MNILNLLNGHFLREKNSKSESNSEIYKFRSSLFESRALKKCYVEFVKFNSKLKKVIFFKNINICIGI